MGKITLFITFFLFNFSVNVQTSWLETVEPLNSINNGLEKETFEIPVASNSTTVNSFDPVVIPENDSCENAIEVDIFPYNNEQDAFGATNNDGFISQCGGLGMNDGVWYLVAGNDYEITVIVEDTPDWDSEVAIYSGECGNFTCVTSIDTVNDIQELNFLSEVGVDYYINIGYYSGTLDNDEGFFSINVDSPGPSPCIDPSNINITQIELYSATVNWTQNGIANSWEVTYGEAGFDPATEGESILVENDPQINLTNLSSNTSYEFYVKGLCSENESDLVGPETFTTLPLCNPPSNLSVTNITQNSASVSWTENGEASSWQVIYGESGFDPATEGETVLVDNNPETNLTNLSPNTNYEFYIEALCSESQTELSGSASFTTLELPCNPPFDLNVTNITENSASVSWTENGNATSWEVIYGESGFDPVTEGENILVENNPELNLTDLSPNTAYEFYIKALCSDNETELSESENFTTLELPCNPPSNLNVTNITENSASVSWIENGNATSWEVIYGESGFDPATEGESILVENDSQISLTELSSNTSYEFYVKGLCSENESDLVGPETFTTLPLCNPPSDLSVTNITQNSASVSWTENGEASSWQVIYGESGFDPATEGESVFVANNPELNLTNLSPNTAYDFYVEALCSEGQTELSESENFTTLELPCNPPSNLSVTNITENSASVSWTENGNATSWEVIYGESGFDPATEGENILVENNPELNLTDLSPNTTYEFYIEALCSDNETELSESENFTTLELPCNPPSNLNVTNITENSASVSWIENGNATSWEVIYGESGFDPATEGESILVENDPQISLTELSSNTSYEFYVKGLCSENESDLVGPETFTTLPLCNPPSDLSVTNITENSASVSWTENGEATSWEVIYGESGFDPATEGESVFVANNPELNLTDLSPNTAYDFYVEALCSEGQTELSESAIFTTLELPCNPPSNLNVTNITENSASVSWMENGNATSWEVIYGESGFDPVTEGESILVENDPQINLTNLSPNTTYEFYIEALCSEGQTELSESENFTTLELPCNPPSNLNVTNITENSASVSWMENGNATSWEVIYGESGFDPAIEGESILVANNPELNLTDLSPNTTYEFYIEALCSDNETELSEAVSFTTLELPCNPPSNLNVTNITENSANVSWTENGNATSWEVTYGESGFDPATEGESILVADNPELNLTDLSPNTTYEFYIEALCSDNETELSEAASFTTLEFSCNPPSDLSVTSITENSAIVSWTENGNATSWEVIYGESGFDPATEGESILVANNPELNLMDLLPDTAYEFYVKALCLDNETELSISQNFITEGLSVNESNFSSFNYYPNPTSSVINLEAGHRISQIEIYSVTGKRLMFFQPHSLRKEINLESMAAGIYLMTITIENQIKTFKIIKE